VQRELTMEALGNTKMYDNVAMGPQSVDVYGRQNGDTATLEYRLQGATDWTAGLPSITNVNQSATYEIRASVNDNYIPVTGTVVLTITPRPVTITASGSDIPLRKTFNTPDPAIGYTLSTLPATIGAAQLPEASVAREPGEDIGVYDIDVSYDATTARNSNYTITPVPGMLEIVAGDGLTATAPDVTVTYDGNSHGIDVTVNLPAGAPAGAAPTILYYTPENPAFLTTQPEKVNVADSGIINYLVKLQGYGDFYGSATVTILPREITLTANSYSKGTDEADPNFDGVMTGELVNANDLGLVDYGLKYATDDTSKEGAYALTATYDSNPNYNVTVVDGVLTVSDTTPGGSVPEEPEDPFTPDPGPVVTPEGDPVTPYIPTVPGETTPTPPEDEPVREPAQPDESEPAQPDESTPAPIEQQDPADPTAVFSGPVWALLNLILMILALVFSVILFVMIFTGRKKKENENADAVEGEEEETKGKRGLIWRILAIVMGVVSLVVFLLTENLSNPMVFVDTWTLLMVIISVAQVILMLVLRQVRQPKDEDEEENTQAQA